MRVNAELFLLDNALMNALTLLLASALSGLRLRRPWIVAGLSLLGALYAMLALALWQWLLWLPVRLLLGLVLSLGLCGWGIKGFLLGGICTLLAAILLGGLALALTLWTGGRVASGAIVGAIPARAALWTVALALLLPRLVRGLVMKRCCADARALLQIEQDNALREYTALVDTGNLVTEPLSGLPVVLLQEKPLLGGLPVPYAGLGGTGMLFAKRPAHARARINGAWQELDIMIAHAQAPFPQGVQAILPGAALRAQGINDEKGWRMRWRARE